MEEEIEDEFYCGEEDKNIGFTEQYKQLMTSITNRSPTDTKQDIFRQRPILGNRILTPIRDEKISDADFTAVWQDADELEQICEFYEGRMNVIEIINRANELRHRGVRLKKLKV